ncbi:sulfatase-like hydrolase/transferase [Dyadobacter tibetensis]|uniref:sulfatase-like hydrolase/transferase n=1 Tax=Dyadobacter tibetensis TaxID=1211851 RepID=UPI00047234FB|nr:sulfatase-like hydrolase/transferase [Dyadobacter tibetensis]
MIKLYLYVCCFVLFSWSAYAQSPAVSERPNIIIMMADDLGYGDLACYGNANIKTPNLDILAQKGIKFLDFHTNGVVCSPTRASLLTGKYPQSTGVTGVITAKDHRDVGLGKEEILISELLKKYDYRTGLVGKWHLGYDTTYSPVNQGFDVFKGFVSGNVDYHTHYDQENYFDWWLGKKPDQEKGYTTDLITEHSLAFIEKHKKNPFFLYIAHEAPHAPYQNRESKPTRTGDKSYQPQPLEDSLKVYHQMIEIMDEGVGRILQALEDHQIAENTLVLFLSDNGASKIGSNLPYRGQKSQVYEGGHRVPAMAYWKGVTKASENNALLMTMDIYPTICDLIGEKLSPSTDLPGISFKDILYGNTAKVKDRPVYWSFGRQAAVREGNWKLVKIGQKYQLYNLKEDISEKNDLILKNNERANHLKATLEGWLAQMKTIPKKS